MAFGASESEAMMILRTAGEFLAERLTILNLTKPRAGLFSQGGLPFSDLRSFEARGPQFIGTSQRKI